MAGFAPDKVQKYQKAIDNVRETLSALGLAPGDEVWVIHNGCYACPEADDHCGIGCTRKEKRYLEKTTLKSVSIEMNAEGGFSTTYTDADDNEYGTYNLDETLFTDREEALEKV